LLEYILKLEYNFDGIITSLDVAPERFQRIISELDINAVKINVEEATSEELISVMADADLVVFSEVFEHLRLDLLGTMNNISEALPAGCRFYLTTPNGLGFRQTVRGLRGYSGPRPIPNWRKLKDVGHMGHVREYSKREIYEILREVRFKDIDIKILPHWNSAFSENYEHTLIRIAETLCPSKGWCIQALAMSGNP
jgi:hypothetical protein